MVHHLRAHCAGKLDGRPPVEYLAAHNLCTCSICGVLLSAAHNGCCPKCRPQLRSAVRPVDIAGADAAIHGGDNPMPSFDHIFTTRVATCRYVPRGARDEWAECLATALADVVCRNTEAAWRRLLALPKAVLCAPPRAGHAHKQKGAFARVRCGRWLADGSSDLWKDSPSRARGNRRRGAAEP
eukprot:gene3111-6928_t